jgi:hypothetical protein
MDWNAVGAIGEIVGAIAVFLTLVYLAIQIRQNTHSMDESRKVELARNRTQLVQLRTDRMLEESRSNETLEIYLRLDEAGFPNPESIDILTPLELARFGRLQRVNLIINMNAKYQYEQGLLDDAAYDTSDRILKVMTPVWLKLGFESLLRDRNIEGEV